MSNKHDVAPVRIVKDNSRAAPMRQITAADVRLALKQNALADLTDIARRLSGLDPDIDQLLVAPIAALRAEIAKG
jgi:hypothetical protein